MDVVLHGFGAAAYNAQVLERKLITLLSCLFAARDLPSADVAFDRAMGNLETLTLGRLIRTLQNVMSKADDLDRRLAEALEVRNYLAHRFFWGHAEDELSETGRASMLVELSEASERFYRLAGEIDALTESFMRDFTNTVIGATCLPEVIADAVDRLYQQTIARELGLMRERAERRDDLRGV